MWAVAIVPVTLQDKFKAEAKKHCTQIYIPQLRYSKKVKHKSQPVEMSKPAFGSYIFVRIRDGRLRKVLDLKTCKGFVMSLDEVANVPERTIKQIRALEAMNFEQPPKPVLVVNVGDPVRVDHDAFKGNIGKVLALLRKGQVEIGLGNVSFIVAIDKIRSV